MEFQQNFPVDKLIPYARNSRTHNDEQVAQIMASIKEFGFTNPVLIAEDGTLIAGHGRVLAASVNRMLETVSARSVAIAQIEQRHKALIGGLPDAVAVAVSIPVTISSRLRVRRMFIPRFSAYCSPKSSVFNGFIMSSA